MQHIYWLIWLLIIPLRFLLIFEYLLVCLGQIMKATCCLLKYNSEPVNLTLLCLNCEIPKNHVNSCIWRGLSHLIRRLMNGPWSGASFVEYLYSFSFMLCFHVFFLVVASPLFLNFIQMHGLWGRRTWSGYELLQGNVSSRLRCYQRIGQDSV